MAFKPWLLFAFVGLTLGSTVGCQTTPDQELVGAWSADRLQCQIPALFEDEGNHVANGIYSTQLKLSADHTFSLTGLYQIGGTWSYSKGVLALNPASRAPSPNNGSYRQMLQAWIEKHIRRADVSTDFSHMTVKLRLPMGTVVIVLDKTA